MAYGQLYIAFWQILDSRNLLVINKNSIKGAEYPVTPCRIVTDWDELDIIVEISPEIYQRYIKPDFDYNSPLTYCRTYEITTGTTPQNVKYWYVTSVNVSEDLACRVTLHRDTLENFWAGAEFSNVKDTPVIVNTESEPTDSATKFTGQKVIFKETQIEGDEINNLFPYAWFNNIANSTGWMFEKLFLIEIASSKTDDTNASHLFYDSRAGSTTYITDYVGLMRLTNYLTTSGIFEEISKALTSGDAGNAVIRIAKSPIPFPSSVLSEVESINVGGGFTIPVTHGSTAVVTGGVNARFFTLYRYSWTTPSDDTDGFYWKSLGMPYTFVYDVNEVERMELTMPFADKVDLTNFIDFFDGQFTVGYVIDMLTGEGMLGVVKGDSIKCNELEEGWLTKFDLIIPIQTYLNIDWIEVQSNEFQRFFNAFNILTGVSTYNFGALSTLKDDPTTISPHRNTANANAEKLLIYGRFMKWGVKYTCRTKGVVNQGFRHVIQTLESLPVQITSRLPDNNYNIQTVTCQRRAWTGNKNVDDDIYYILTQRGFVKNI